MTGEAAGQRIGTRVLPLVLVGLLLLVGCPAEGLAFRTDDRLTITSPDERSVVTLPVTIRWQVEDFEITPEGVPATDSAGDAGFFGVFIDSTPPPPGETLDWIARGDEACQRKPNCPDKEYFEVRGVHTTTRTSFTIRSLPRPQQEGRRELHEVTLVLLDPAGERIGESAWSVEFEVDRDEAT